MQNDRDNQNRGYGDQSRNRNDQNRDYIGYSAIPGPSFDTGRYVSDQDRSFDHDRGRGEDRDRRYGDRNFASYSTDKIGGGTNLGGGSTYTRDRDYGGYSRENSFDANRDRNQGGSDSNRMGGMGGYGGGNDFSSGSYGGSDRSSSRDIGGGYEGSRGFGGSGRSTDYRRNSQYGSMGGGFDRSYSGQDYSAPDYPSIQSGGRFDSNRSFGSDRGFNSGDRGFNSGGISSMGGDYDRDRTRGRQYRDNYDSSGGYIGDYGNRGSSNDYSNQGHNSYDSSFTYGGGSSSYGDNNRNQQYSSRDRGLYDYGDGNQSRWGGRYGREQDYTRNLGSHYGSSGYNRNWREDRDRNSSVGSGQGRSESYSNRSHGFNTGNSDYDRRNFGAADYVYDRNRQEDEDRGFIDKATDRVRSWFGADDNDRNRY